MSDAPDFAQDELAEFTRLQKAFAWNIDAHATMTSGIWITKLNPELSYPEEGHDVCASVEDRSFWFRIRNLLIEELAKKYKPAGALWEIGSGNGYVSQHLRSKGIDVVAVEPGMTGARNAGARGIRKSICGLLEDLKLPDQSLHALGCFDVLEHLDKPQDLLREFARILIPKSYVYISVPAFPFLWSQADDIAGHCRRYSRRSADAMMEQAGFKSVTSRYIMSSMFIPLFLLRSLPYRLGRRKSKEACLTELKEQLAPKNSGALAETMLNFERILTRYIALPFGTSVLGVYQKP